MDKRQSYPQGTSYRESKGKGMNGCEENPSESPGEREMRRLRGDRGDTSERKCVDTDGGVRKRQRSPSLPLSASILFFAHAVSLHLFPNFILPASRSFWFGHVLCVNV